MQLGGWKLTDWPAELDEAEFAVRHEGQQYVIDVIGKQVQTQHLQQSAQFDFSGAAAAWDDLALSRWLDRQLAAPDITQADKLEFCRRAVDALRSKRGLPLDELVRFKYLLLQAMRYKIEKARRQAAAKGWQAALFPGEPAFVLTFDAAEAFTFDAARGYAPRSPYRGSHKFSKEFYGKTGELEASGEEFECAKALDMQPGVKHWFRNISNDAARSFWLPTSSDRFYPDFVAELIDGRILVIEYKGDRDVTNDDTKEKQNIGDFWQERSGGRALFLIAVAKDEAGRGVFDQIAAKIK